jgi:hypothetical protein
MMGAVITAVSLTVVISAGPDLSGTVVPQRAGAVETGNPFPTFNVLVLSRLQWLAPRVEAIDQSCTATVVEVTVDSILVREDRPGRLRRFVVSATLAAGDYPRSPILSQRYKLSDVNVGDIVNIDYNRINGMDICWAVGVRRRPGGRIPHGHYPPDSLYLPHEQAQALQDFEEHGIPLPEKYRPRFIRILPMAPMPREVKLSGPAISP